NAIARFELRDGIANLFNHASAILTWCVRQSRQSRIRSGADVSFHRVNADRVYSNKHFTGTGLRSGHFSKPKNFRITKFLHANRLHCPSFVILSSAFSSCSAGKVLILRRNLSAARATASRARSPFSLVSR